MITALSLGIFTLDFVTNLDLPTALQITLYWAENSFPNSFHMSFGLIQTRRDLYIASTFI